MKQLIQISILTVASIIVHMIAQTIISKYIEWPNDELIRPVTIISTMLVILIASYFAIKQLNNKKPRFKDTYTVLFSIQFITLLSLNILPFQNLLQNQSFKISQPILLILN